MSADVGSIRYPAFLSYSHRDAVFARRLHRRLEAYALPRRLVGRSGPRGAVPARLTPIFRDREELSAADDLSAEVRAALAASGALIVVCSPAAAASPWVAREIDTFRDLHPDRPVLAVLAEGEPGDAFPPLLLNGGTEPLAADFRKGQDGEGLGFLKLVSGIAGVGLDELIQRDAQRRLRAVTAVTAGAVAVMLAMGGLAVFAFEARAEADRRRADAEGLVEFMLTDLRGRLRSVGRLDIMEAVNTRALAHYSAVPTNEMSLEELTRRAKVLQAIGEDLLEKGKTSEAAAKFRESKTITGALLAQNPSSSAAIMADAQSEYWLGFLSYVRGERDGAQIHFEAYDRLAGRLLRSQPKSPLFLREAGYAKGNLCALALKQEATVEVALDYCSAARDFIEAAAASPEAPVGIRADLANREAWLADVFHRLGDRKSALAHRQKQQELLTELISEQPLDMTLRSRWITLQRAIANLEFEMGDPAAARARLAVVDSLQAQMAAFDSENRTWIAQLELIRADRERTKLH